MRVILPTIVISVAADDPVMEFSSSVGLGAAERNIGAADRVTAPSVDHPEQELAKGKGDGSPMHDAVLSTDLERVHELRAAGHRPTQLDGQGRSPLDALDRSDMSPAVKSAIRAALLKSSNPTAPVGHRKWEAGHGTPWGLEVIARGSLLGGVNDPKGGKQSIEGKVFFSDRTPKHEADGRTRDDLRVKARTYAAGESTRSAGASNRALQYRFCQALMQSLGEGGSIDMSAEPVRLTHSAGSPLNDILKRFLQERISVLRLRNPDMRVQPHAALARLALPTEIHVAHPETGEAFTVSGEALAGAYEASVASLREELEGGKAPFLAVINDGEVVPLVFGFEKIDGLKGHRIRNPISRSYVQYGYKDGAHPLEGDRDGGKLLEVEVRNRADLATLRLGMLAKEATLPVDAVFRVRDGAVAGEDHGRATYMSPGEVQAFHGQVVEDLSVELGLPIAEVPRAIPRCSIADLQMLNRSIRRKAALPRAESGG